MTKNNKQNYLVVVVIKIKINASLSFPPHVRKVREGDRFDPRGAAPKICYYGLDSFSSKRLRFLIGNTFLR